MARTVEPGRMGLVTDYGKPLLENDLDSDPLRQFAAWFGEAGAAGVREPQAAALATASTDGVPSVRVASYNFDNTARSDARFDAGQPRGQFYPCWRETVYRAFR